MIHLRRVPSTLSSQTLQIMLVRPALNPGGGTGLQNWSWYPCKHASYIVGPVYNVIKSIYSATSYRVKIGDHISSSFLATSGVKQGCPMSPLLSNIYNIQHLSDCDPVKMGSVHINSLSWADDLMLPSTSISWLKRCLENLKTYCQKCGLVVNTEKTKTMVLSKKKYIQETFTFGDIPLQASKSINYLGFVISYNGKYRSITHDRIMKAINMNLQAIRTNRNVSIRLALSLLTNKLLQFFSMDVRYGHYPTLRVLFIWWINRSAQI